MSGTARRVRIEDVAREAGVARSTAALALRDGDRLRQETRDAVREAALRLGYVYDRAAARLRSGRSFTIGLLVCELTNPFYAELTAGVQAALDESGYVAVLANTAESPERQRRMLERFREQPVDGIIIMPASGTPDSLRQELDGFGLPHVTVVRELGEGPHAGPDNSAGTRLATRHLLALGHRRIAFMGGASDNSVARGRRAGYAETMREAGLTPHLLPCRHDFGDAVNLAAELQPRQHTALVCANDPIAFGACNGLLRQGLSVPRDMAVVGFDDIREAAIWHPPLTTVRASAKAMGADAARLLLERIADPGAPPRRIILPPELVVRESCGAWQA